MHSGIEREIVAMKFLKCKTDMQESTTIFKVDAFGGNPGALFLCLLCFVLRQALRKGSRTVTQEGRKRGRKRGQQGRKGAEKGEKRRGKCKLRVIHSAGTVKRGRGGGKDGGAEARKKRLFSCCWASLNLNKKRRKMRKKHRSGVVGCLHSS